MYGIKIQIQTVWENQKCVDCGILLIQFRKCNKFLFDKFHTWNLIWCFARGGPRQFIIEEMDNFYEKS